MVSITPKTRSLINGTANDATPVEQNFIELYANDTVLNNAVNTLENTALRAQMLPGLNMTGVPVQQTETTLNVSHILCTNTIADGLISKTTPTVVDMNTFGLNGIAQSANLTGTISVVTGANTVSGVSTSFTTLFQVGDVIRTNGGQSRRITFITSATLLSVESTWSTTEAAVTYRRGGRAPNTWYHLYAIASPTQAGLMVSTRNPASNDILIDLPSGFNRYRQLALSFKTNSSSNIIPFMVASGWPTRPMVLFTDFERSSQYLAISATGVSVFTNLSLAAMVPTTARLSVLLGSLTNPSGVAGTGALRGAGSTGNSFADLGDNLPNNTQVINNTILMPTGALQQIEYRATGGASIGVWVRGFCVTEVV
jgi:hypothetical protein